MRYMQPLFVGLINPGLKSFHRQYNGGSIEPPFPSNSPLFLHIAVMYLYILVKFPRPPEQWQHRRHLWAPSTPPLGRLRGTFGKPPPSAAVKEEEKKNWGLKKNGIKNVTRSIRIPNMCLVLKSDNGKVGRLRRPIFRAPGAPRSGRELSLRRLRQR